MIDLSLGNSRTNACKTYNVVQFVSRHCGCLTWGLLIICTHEIELELARDKEGVTATCFFMKPPTLSYLYTLLTLGDECKNICIINIIVLIKTKSLWRTICCKAILLQSHNRLPWSWKGQSCAHWVEITSINFDFPFSWFWSRHLYTHQLWSLG